MSVYAVPLQDAVRFVPLREAAGEQEDPSVQGVPLMVMEELASAAFGTAS